MSCGCPHTRARRDAELEDLPGVRNVIDTRKGRGDDLGIGHLDGPDLITYHVTDDPERIVQLIRRRADLVAAYGEKGKFAELGPGLYTSGKPEFWAGRARKKWSFLKRLTPSEWQKLTRAIEKEVLEQNDRGYITSSEKARAIRDLTLFESGHIDEGVLVAVFANPPYSISFWKPEFLRPLGIEPGESTGIVELRVRGRFAELSGSYPPPALLRTLRRAGLQGAFTRAGMSTNPELVIWDRKAIVSAKILPPSERDPSSRRKRSARTKRRPVSDYRLRRRVYWSKLKELLARRYGKRPTSEGHRVADEAFRRRVPVARLARRIASDRKLSRSAYEIGVEPTMRIR